MIGVKQEARKLNIRTSLCASQGTPPGTRNEDGTLGNNCKHCGEYEQELDDNGYCSNDECRRERLIDALLKGEAMRVKNAEGEYEILWTPGVKIAAK